jgi:hypothetical protein
MLEWAKSTLISLKITKSLRDEIDTQTNSKTSKKKIQWQGAFLVLQVFNFFSLYSSNIFLTF